MTSELIPVLTLDLAIAPAAPEQIVEGSPQISHAVFSRSADGRVQRGVWQMTPGTIRDTEGDELFVVLEGRATIEVEDGRTIDVGPGDVVVLQAGDRTTWRVQETLRKVYQLTLDPPEAA